MKATVYMRFASKEQASFNEITRNGQASNTQNTAVIYARSAAAEQAEQSISKQVEACMEFARANGYEVEKVYSEIGSGLNDQRPQLQQLIQDSNTKKWKAVIIFNTDRLSRKLNAFFEFKTILQKQNITLHSTTKSNLTHSAIEQFVNSRRNNT